MEFHLILKNVAERSRWDLNPESLPSAARYSSAISLWSCCFSLLLFICYLIKAALTYTEFQQNFFSEPKEAPPQESHESTSRVKVLSLCSDFIIGLTASTWCLKMKEGGGIMRKKRLANYSSY